jgi:hypothetical protein
MTRDADAAPDPVRLHKELDRIWTAGRGLGRLAAVNHTAIGLRFIVTAAVFFAIGGLLAMLIRAQIATPRSAFVGPEIYNQIFTMHGTVMMFLFAIPMIEGLAIYLLPKMLGARDLAFPRLSAFGYWCYLFGGTIMIVALVVGAAPDAGWFMYTPLSSQPYSPGVNADVWLLGITFVEISAMTVAVELVVTILMIRAPGMTLTRMPIFAWYMLITAFMILVGFPPLILGSVLLEMERAFGLPFFDPERGGSPLLWQHLFWLFGHPEVYIIFLPGAAVLSTMIPTLRAAAAGRLSGDPRGDRGARLSKLRHLGAPHVHRGHPASCARLLLGDLGARRGADGGADLRLARDARTRQAALGPAHALCLRLLLRLRDRRADRGDARHGAVQQPGSRHAFRRGAPALRADRRLRLSDAGRALLLAAARHRAPGDAQPRRCRPSG